MTVGDVKLYSLKEIAERNGENGSEIWIIIKDMVYNVTPYLDDHPGGGDLITEWAGKDATKAYNDFGHSGDADRMLKKYKIGELIDEDRKSKKKTKIQKPAKDEKPKDEKPKIIEKQPNNTTNSMNSSATAEAKAKEAEASAGFEKDRGIIAEEAALTHIKSQYSSAIKNVEEVLRPAVSNIPPRFDLLCNKKQAHPSH